MGESTQESSMQRIRIQPKQRRKIVRAGVTTVDPRDPDVVRAKARRPPARARTGR
jgi:hypothetical protein